MADAYIVVTEDSTSGKLVDNTSLTVGADTVYRQRVTIAGSSAALLAEVLASNPASSEYGLVVRVLEAKGGTGAITVATASTSSQVVLAANAARIGASVYSNSTEPMYLAFSGSAATSSYTVILSEDDFYELGKPMYTGALSAMWGAAAGTASITEVTT